MLVGSVLVGDIPPVAEVGYPTIRRLEIGDVVISCQNVAHVLLEPTPTGAKPLNRPPPKKAGVQLYFGGGMGGAAGPEPAEVRNSLGVRVQKDLLPVGVPFVNVFAADTGSR